MKSKKKDTVIADCYLSTVIQKEIIAWRCEKKNENGGIDYIEGNKIKLPYPIVI